MKTVLLLVAIGGLFVAGALVGSLLQTPSERGIIDDRKEVTIDIGAEQWWYEIQNVTPAEGASISVNPRERLDARIASG